jgi:hypothetical protein
MPYDLQLLSQLICLLNGIFILLKTEEIFTALHLLQSILKCCLNCWQQAPATSFTDRLKESVYLFSWLNEDW